MDKQEMLRQLDTLLELEPGTLTGDEQLADIEEWDSLAGLGFIALADQSHGRAVSAQSLTDAVTVEDLLALLRGDA